MGDPTGVGPESIAKAWAAPRLHAEQRLFVIGHPEIMQRAVDLVGTRCRVEVLERADDCGSAPDILPVMRAGSDEALAAAPATIDPRGGQAAYEALALGARLALDGHVAGLVTAPLHKTALAAAGHDYPGHTELLAQMCGVPADQVAMMLYLPPGKSVAGRAGLGVVHATLHVALREACARLNQAAIVGSAHLARDVLRALGSAATPLPRPRIGVCALNPHGGENGLFGDEEQTIIGPAVVQAAAEGLSIEGPLPADTLMVRAAAGEFDAVVAMYHDQGHIALKLLDMHRAVNITLGLPIVRTSVAHGTAHDVAWQGTVDASSLLQAVEVAARLAAHRPLTTAPSLRGE